MALPQANRPTLRYVSFATRHPFYTRHWALDNFFCLVLASSCVSSSACSSRFFRSRLFSVLFLNRVLWYFLVCAVFYLTSFSARACRLEITGAPAAGSCLIRDNVKVDIEIAITDCPARFNYGGLLLPHTQLQLDPSLPHLFLVLAPKEPDRKFRTDLLPTQVMNVQPTGMNAQNTLHVELTPLKGFVALPTFALWLICFVIFLEGRL